jgi:hypothetical protein
MGLLKMKVEDVVRDARHQPVVLLKEEEGIRALPIWIGEAEAAAIKLEMEGEKAPRPLTHDLMKELLDLVGFRLLKVEVTDVRRDTFYAELTLQGEGGPAQKVDCRPSDAIALALRTKSPIFIAEELFARIEKEQQETVARIEEEQREAIARAGKKQVTRVDPGEPTIH